MGINFALFQQSAETAGKPDGFQPATNMSFRGYERSVGNEQPGSKPTQSFPSVMHGVRQGGLAAHEAETGYKVRLNTCGPIEIKRGVHPAGKPRMVIGENLTFAGFDKHKFRSDTDSRRYIISSRTAQFELPAAKKVSFSLAARSISDIGSPSQGDSQVQFWVGLSRNTRRPKHTNCHHEMFERIPKCQVWPPL